MTPFPSFLISLLYFTRVSLADDLPHSYENKDGEDEMISHTSLFILTVSEPPNQHGEQ